jgi:hypothetical protein
MYHRLPAGTLAAMTAHLGKTAAAAAALVLALTACSSGHPASHSTGSAGLTSEMHAWAQCLRNHGAPNLHDPSLVDGKVQFPSVQDKRALTPQMVSACASLAAQLPGIGQNTAPDAATLHKMTQFSACMRAHGLADWPDPNSDGTFPLPPDITSRGKAGMHTQLDACKHIWNGSISVATTPPSQ